MADKFAEDVAARIRKRAEELGLTQAEVVRKTGAAKSTVHGWFNGVSTPRGASAAKLRGLLRCSHDWLFEGRGAPSAVNSEALFSSLDSTIEAVDNKLNTELVRCPRLNFDGKLVQDDMTIVPKSAVAVLDDVRSAGWVKATSKSAKDVVLQGDIVVLDSSVNDVAESGAFYVMSHGTGVNVHQVFAEVDGSWSVIDADRDSKMTVGVDHREKIRILGRVVWRSGLVV